MEQAKLISRNEYCAELRKYLPEECFKTDSKHIIFYVICMSFYLLSIYSILNIEFLPLKILISILAGITLSSLTFFLHDLFHGSITKSTTLEYLLGISIGIFNLFAPLFWKRVHNFHHARTGNLDDPDRSYIQSESPKSIIEKFAYRSRLTKESFHPIFSLVFMSTGFLWYFLNTMSNCFYPKSKFENNKNKNVHKLFKPKGKLFVVMELLVILLFQIFLFSFIAKGVILNYFLISILPVAIAHFTTMLYIHTNHFLSPLTGEIDDPLANSLSLKNMPFIDTIFSNFSHHTEHHLFPSMSSIHYPKVRKLLLKLYPERFQLIPMKEAVRLLTTTPRIYKDYTHLVTSDGKTVVDCPRLIKK